MHFPNIILKQMIAFSRRTRETFPCAPLSRNVNFVYSDPCAELGEVDAWDSFSVNNTCFIAPNLIVYADSLAITCIGPKDRLLMRQDCRLTIKWLPDREMSATCGASLKGHFGHAVHPPAALTSKAPSSASPMAAHYVQFSAHSALGCSKVHRKETTEGGCSFLLLRSGGCVFFPSPPLTLSFVSHDKESGGISEEDSLSPTTTFSQCWTCAD